MSQHVLRQVPESSRPGTSFGANDAPDDVVVDCDTCVAQYTSACDDCLVTALLGPDERAMRLDGDESRAVIELQAAGLVPPVRYRPAS